MCHRQHVCALRAKDQSAKQGVEARYLGGRTGLGGWSVPQVGQGRGVWDSTALRTARFAAASMARPSRRSALARSGSKGWGFFGFGDMRVSWVVRARGWGSHRTCRGRGNFGDREGGTSVRKFGAKGAVRLVLPVNVLILERLEDV